MNKLTKSARIYLKMVRASRFNPRETANYLRSLYEEFGSKAARAEIDRIKGESHE